MSTFPARDPLVMEPYPGVLIKFSLLPNDFKEGATILPGKAQELRQHALHVGKLFASCYDQPVQDNILFDGRAANLALLNEKPLDPANSAPALVEFVRSVSDYVTAKEIVEAQITGANGRVELNDPGLHGAMETLGLTREMETPSGRSLAAAIDRWLYQCSRAREQTFEVSIGGEMITLRVPPRSRIFPAGEPPVVSNDEFVKRIDTRAAKSNATLLLSQEGGSYVVLDSAIKGRPEVGRSVNIPANDLKARCHRIRVCYWSSNKTKANAGDAG